MSTTETVVVTQADNRSSAEMLRDVVAEISGVLVEADETVHMMVLHVLAKQHLLLVGAPGVAKSLAVREFFRRVEGAEMFEMLLHQAMPPDELLGHISPAMLMEDRMVHNTRFKLPEANFAFLDEIFRAGSTLLNPLLTILNERVFHNDGKVVHVPLWSCIAASNSLPSDPVLAAFRDRFASTLEVKAVKSDLGFKEIMAGGLSRRAHGGGSPITATIPRKAIEFLQGQVTQVVVPDEVLDALAKLRNDAEDFGMIVSPRRYQAGLNLCQAQAVLGGRDRVAKSDLALFEHVLWLDLEDQAKAYQVASMYAGRVKRLTTQLQEALDNLNEQLAEAGKDDPQFKEPDSLNKGARILSELKRLRGEIAQAVDDTDGEDPAPLNAISRKADEFAETLNKNVFGG